METLLELISRQEEHIKSDASSQPRLVSVLAGAAAYGVLRLGSPWTARTTPPPTSCVVHPSLIDTWTDRHAGVCSAISRVAVRALKPYFVTDTTMAPREANRPHIHRLPLLTESSPLDVQRSF